MAHPATIDHVGTELSLLRRQAEALAKERKEPISTCHLLAVLSEGSGAVSDLLRERGLTAARILDQVDRSPESKSSGVERSFVKAVELARRMGASRASAAHLLMAILADPTSHGRRGIERLNIDLARLRSQAWNHGIGWAPRKSVATKSAQASPVESTKNAALPAQGPERRRGPAGVTIPLFPPGQSGALKKKPAGKAQPLPIVPERAQRRDEALEPQDSAGGEPSAADESRDAALPRAKAGINTKRTRRTLERFELDPQRFAILTRFGTNLTLEAARNRSDEVVGRELEIEQVLDVLAKRQSNCPCLVGPSGVGKTSVVRGLAQRIARNEASASLDERIVVEVHVGELLAGTGVRGALAQRISALRQEVKQADGKIVIFFDEIHLLFVGDAADESAGEFKLALSRGEFPCVGATTAEDYRRSIEADPALSRRFAAIEVEEPSPEDAYLVLESTAKKLSLHHGVRFGEDALALGIGWSVRYLPGRCLPEKAISIADLAGARARRRGQSEVTAEHVAEIVAKMANLPVERLLETDAERMLVLEQLIGKRVVGHGAEIARICSVLRRNAAGLGAERPIGTFLLLGPTGVGKTETAKAIAQALFHSEAAMTRLDMAEYSESHAVAKLIGAPPGYVGHDAGGQLTEAVRKRPYQVLLLDEIEKAHDEVLQAFLGVFDEGRLTDSRGRTVDFRNTIILMTSNLGAEHTQSKPKRRVGFAGDSQPIHADVHEAVIAAARGRLSPELYNRIDECLVFSALSRDEVRLIAKRLIGRLERALFDRGVALRVTDAALELLMEQGGFDLCLGARPMKRTIARLIEAPLAERLLAGNVRRGSSVVVDVEDNRIGIYVDPARDGADRTRAVGAVIN